MAYRRHNGGLAAVIAVGQEPLARGENVSKVHEERDTMRYEDKFRDYEFRINWTSSKPFNPACEVVEVVLQTKDGKEYASNFLTQKYLNYVSKKNKRTGECASGTYFAVPNMVVVDKITNQSIKKTIDAMIEEMEVEIYFEKIS